ncbi:MAG: M16 family metallopeptidase, partial [Bacteroidota bacterium]
RKVNTIISFDCDPERATELKAKVQNEVQRLVNEGPGQEHLDKAVNNVLKNREESKQHNSYWMTSLYTYYLSGINYHDPSNFEDILKTFTADDIREAAEAFFGDADLVDIIFVPGE